MRIVQITDLHVGREGEETYGVDVRANFLKIKAAIQALQPDHLVVSGDLCFDLGEAPIYHWIKPKLDELAIPYDIISGNHDDPVLLAQIFEKSNFLYNKEFYFTKELGNKQVIFLDTTKGCISTEQLDWLKQQLEEINEEVVIFMHHPPLLANVPFMDINHALKNRVAIQEVFFNYPHNITVFTGHYHVEKTIRKKNLTVHITPSCFFQIDQHSQEFKIDHHRIGLREIFYEDGTIMSTVRYI